MCVIAPHTSVPSVEGAVFSASSQEVETEVSGIALTWLGIATAMATVTWWVGWIFRGVESELRDVILYFTGKLGILKSMYRLQCQCNGATGFLAPLGQCHATVPTSVVHFTGNHFDLH